VAKQVYVILAFHAHEPLWEMPGYLMQNSLDRAISLAVRPDNCLSKRTTEGRNLYQEMLAAARRLSAPFTLDITNTLLVQIGQLLPQTLQAMSGAYQEGWLRPLYIPAHHTHLALLCEEELREEVRLNQQFLHEVMEVPRPRHPGLFFTECSVDSHAVPMIEEMGLEWCVFPELNPRRALYAVSEPGYDYTFRPFRVGERLIALPRHFPVSQAIWRPITRLDPQRVKYQGYLMGQYFVFDEEYRSRELLEAPIPREQAFEEYRLLLEQTLEAAPEGGLILYIQDLELMDFGDIALEILTAGWEAVREDPRWQIHFVGADEYLEGVDGGSLPRVSFHQTSWAPELRLVLRSDGHYPPLEAGEFRGLDFVAEVHRRRPFLFWEPGRYLCGLFEWLLRSFGFPVLVEVSAALLAEEDYQLLRLPYTKRLPLHLRLLKQADNWGWMPNEDQAKRPYLHGYMIADALALLLRLFTGQYPRSPRQAAEGLFEGIARLPEGIIDTRLAYLTFGLKRQQEERGLEPAEAFRELDYARHFRNDAVLAARDAARLYEDLSPDFADQQLWARLLERVREHCRGMFLSLDHIQRAWGKGGDTEYLVEKMYLYLYDLYPPIFPRLMDEVEGKAPSPPPTPTWPGRPEEAPYQGV
jgi:hypothetical protein